MALFLESWETYARAHSSQGENQVQCRLQYFPSCGDKTPWRQLQRKGVYLALSSRVQFPGRESWLQGLLEAGHDASQIRKQRTGFLFTHSRVQTSGTVALTSQTYLLTSINLKQSPSAMLKACYLGNSRSHPVGGHDHL